LQSSKVDLKKHLDVYFKNNWVFGVKHQGVWGQTTGCFLTKNGIDFQAKLV